MKALKPHEFALKAHEYARQVMESMGHNNFDLMVVVGTDDVTYPIVAQRPEGMPAMDYVCMVLDGMTAQLSLDLGEVSWALLHTDSYAREVPEEEDLSNYQRGENERLFLAGSTQVREALQTILLTDDETVTIQQSYKYTPVDGWEWDEPESFTNNETHYSLGSRGDWTLSNIKDVIKRKRDE